MSLDYTLIEIITHEIFKCMSSISNLHLIIVN